MKTASCIILLCEIYAVVRLFRKYDTLEIEEFITRANLEDIIRMRQHSINGFLALGLITILNTWRQ